MKQETLEQAAEKYSYGGREGGHRKPFLEGAKWQQERSYSEQDLRQAIGLSRQIKDGKDLFDLEGILGLTEVCTHNCEILSEEEIIEQFKKK